MLIIERGVAVWVVRHTGRDAQQVRELFGGWDTLPTPYTLQMPRRQVAKYLAQLNPDKRIIYYHQ